MFIELHDSGYNRNGQYARGKFLVLMRPKNGPIRGNNIRAIVRVVTLRQVGHWMIGRLKVGPYTISLSGAYGADGFPVDVPEEVWKRGVPLPKDLYEAWANSDGWNSVGREAEKMKRWALSVEHNLNPYSKRPLKARESKENVYRAPFNVK